MNETLLAAIDAAEQNDKPGYVFLGSDLSETRYTWREFVQKAKARGRALLQLGLKKGDRLALIVPENEDFILTFLGAVSVGVVPVPMYPPLALGKLDHYAETAARILAASGAKILVTTKQVSPILWSLVGRVKSLKDLVLVDKLAKARVGEPHPEVSISPEDVCFLQFTSGSTSTPKGVVVTHGNLYQNAMDIMFEGLRCTPGVDIGCSWLPLYHDMGLIGYVIAPLVAGVQCVFIPTMTFVRRPSVWLDTVSKYRASICFAPNFAYALAGKYAQRHFNKEGFDLSSVRIFGCGAEPINAETMRHFLETFAPAGLKPESVMPCYGMAEATLAISFDEISTPFETLVIDKERYENEHVAVPFSGEGDGGLEIVSCGRTFSSHQVAIMDDDKKTLGEGEVGEIVLKGPSVTPGYFENEEASQDVYVDGWLHTGDLGFIREGQVFISGRKKDLIILNGRNYHPQAIEWEVEGLPGIRKGNVVAFSVPGETSEELIIVAETRAANDKLEIEKAIRNQVKNEIGLVPREVVLIEAGSLPKTSSGKLQRRKTRQEYLEGTIGVGARSLGSKGTKSVVARHVARSVFAKVQHKVKKLGSKVVRLGNENDSSLPTPSGPVTR